MDKRTLHGPGIRIELDKTEVFPDDPGAGTPAMVYVGRASATFWCALDTGELWGGNVELTDRQVKWLHEQYAEVNEFLRV